LSLTSLQTPSTAVTGKPLSITTLAKNIGPAVGSASFSYYLSSDNNPSADDIVLGTYTDAAGIAADSDSTLPACTFKIASSVAGGRYYVIGVVNSNDATPELDTTNDTFI